MSDKYRFMYLNYADVESIGESIGLIDIAFNAMVRQGLTASVFYDGYVHSVEDFTEHLMRPGCLPLAVFDEQGKMAAFVWLNSMEGKTARGHFVLFREFWGRKKSIPLGRSIFNYLLTLNDSGGYLFDTLVGITPASNTMAYRRSIECGAKYIGIIPGFCTTGPGKEEGGVIVVVTRDTLFSSAEAEMKWETA